MLLLPSPPPTIITSRCCRSAQRWHWMALIIITQYTTKMVLPFEDNEYVLEKELNEIDEEKATPEELPCTRNTTMMRQMLLASWSPLWPLSCRVFMRITGPMRWTSTLWKSSTSKLIKKIAKCQSPHDIQDERGIICVWPHTENATIRGAPCYAKCAFWWGIGYLYSPKLLTRLLWLIHSELSFEQHWDHLGLICTTYYRQWSKYEGKKV